MVKRTETVFFEKYYDWLKGNLDIQKNTTKSCRKKTHCPSNDFDDLTKYNKWANLRSENETETLINAGKMALREKGNIDLSYVISTCGNKYSEVFRKSGTSETKAMCVEALLSRNNFEVITESL